MTRLQVWLRAGSMALSAAFVVGCAQQSGRARTDPIESYDAEGIAAGAVRDFSEIYRRMGLASSGPPISFVGSAASFASASPDTTLVVAAVSIPNRGLVFERDGFQFKAVYEVGIVVRRGDSSEVRRIATSETVRVGSLKETTRTDESIVFTQVLRLPPGQYQLSYTVRDAVGGREASQTRNLVVPRLAAGSISQPVLVYEGTPRTRIDSVPRYLPQPRSSAVFGTDATAIMYLEAYGTTMTTPVILSLHNAQNAVVWRDTAWLAQRNGLASAMVSVPLLRADIGVVALSAVRAGGTDTVRTPVFVGFGPDLPVVSFDDMVEYLRFFTTSSRIHALQTAAASSRGTAWANFLKATDQSPDTPQNEALQDYFTRIRDANFRFRSEATEGWLSDRGSAYVGLGEPDNAYEQQGYSNDPFIGQNGRVRVLIWEYQRLQSRLIFYDETGGGQWRFTPSSASAFRTLLARHLIQ